MPVSNAKKNVAEVEDPEDCCAACGYPKNLEIDRHAPDIAFCGYCLERTASGDDMIDEGDID